MINRLENLKVFKPCRSLIMDCFEMNPSYLGDLYRTPEYFLS